MKARKSHQEIIDEMVRRIKEHVKPEKIILFGSYARGTAGPDSDVDLMVVLSIEKSARRKKAAEIYRLLGGVGLPKDIIIVSPDDLVNYRNLIGTIIKPALEEGKVIYDQAA
jgi:predicted nucleotidyltransferase